MTSLDLQDSVMVATHINYTDSAYWKDGSLQRTLDRIADLGVKRIRDGIKFPDFIHLQKRHPQTGLRDHDMQWDFWSLSPESAHQVAYLMGDRGLPKTWRHMNGYGSHTYSFWNEAGERFWVKFHFKTRQGHETLTDEEAEAIIGKTRESYQEALFGAIERGL